MHTSATAAPSTAAIWVTARGALSLDVPRIMGIVNITPDSFSDGGRFFHTDEAIAQAGRLLEEGADIIDLGGESTRPGASPVAAREELNRVLPVLRGILRRWPNTLVSVDTVKADVAQETLAEGAAAINDVSGLRLDPALASVTAAARAGLILMHSRGTVESMASYETAIYGRDPVAEIVAELQASIDRAIAAGVAMDRIVADPGLGFSKRTEHSVAALAQLDRIAALGVPILVGASRKRFVGELAGGLPVDQRLEGTIAANVVGLLNGARIFRVHEVAPVRRALLVAHAAYEALVRRDGAGR